MPIIFSVQNNPILYRVAQAWAFQNFKSQCTTDFSRLVDLQLWGTLPYQLLFTNLPYDKKIDPKRLKHFLTNKSYNFIAHVTADTWGTHEQTIRAVFLQSFGLAERNSASFTQTNDSLLTYTIPDSNTNITFNFTTPHAEPDALHNFSICGRPVSPNSIELIFPKFAGIGIPEKIILNPEIFEIKNDKAIVNTVFYEMELGHLFKSLCELQYLGIELDPATERYLNILKSTPYEGLDYTGPNVSLFEIAFFYFYKHYYDPANDTFFMEPVNNMFPQGEGITFPVEVIFELVQAKKYSSLMPQFIEPVKSYAVVAAVPPVPQVPPAKALLPEVAKQITDKSQAVLAWFRHSRPATPSIKQPNADGWLSAPLARKRSAPQSKNFILDEPTIFSWLKDDDPGDNVDNDRPRSLRHALENILNRKQPVESAATSELTSSVPNNIPKPDINVNIEKVSITHPELEKNHALIIRAFKETEKLFLQSESLEQQKNQSEFKDLKNTYSDLTNTLQNIQSNINASKEVGKAKHKRIMQNIADFTRKKDNFIRSANNLNLRITELTRKNEKEKILAERAEKKINESERLIKELVQLREELFDKALPARNYLFEDPSYDKQVAFFCREIDFIKQHITSIQASPLKYSNSQIRCFLDECNAKKIPLMKYIDKCVNQKFHLHLKSFIYNLSVMVLAGVILSIAFVFIVQIIYMNATLPARTYANPPNEFISANSKDFLTIFFGIIGCSAGIFSIYRQGEIVTEYNSAQINLSQNIVYYSSFLTAVVEVLLTLNLFVEIGRGHDLALNYMELTFNTFTGLSSFIGLEYGAALLGPETLKLSPS